MPITSKSNGITEVATRDGNVIWLLPSQLWADLKGRALQDGIDGANDEKWLLGEVRYAGQPREEGAECWNCGDTKGFLAPTGDEDHGRVRYRPDGKVSPLSRMWRQYPCPACQNPKTRLLYMLRKAGIADPQVAITRSIHWDMPGREAMGRMVKEFANRMITADTAGLLTLAGPYGVGKSALAEFIVIECVKNNQDALYISAEQFKQAIQDSINGDDGATSLLHRLRTAAVVVFDQVDWIREVTSGGQPSYTAEVFRDVFDFRYKLKRTHATVFIVNLEAWHHSGGDMLAAVYDRMREGQVAVMEAAGIREQLGGMPVERDYQGVI